MLVLPIEGQSGTVDIPFPEFSLDKLEPEEIVEMHMPTFPANSDSVHLLHTLPVLELEIQTLILEAPPHILNSDRVSAASDLGLHCLSMPHKKGALLLRQCHMGMGPWLIIGVYSDLLLTCLKAMTFKEADCYKRDLNCLNVVVLYCVNYDTFV